MNKILDFLQLVHFEKNEVMGSFKVDVKTTLNLGEDVTKIDWFKYVCDLMDNSKLWVELQELGCKHLKAKENENWNKLPRKFKSIQLSGLGINKIIKKQKQWNNFRHDNWNGLLK